MEKVNHTAKTQVTEFILLGLTNSPSLKAPLFGIFLIIYLIPLMGNLGMVILTHLESKLHTPMYFFLRQLSIADLGYSTVIGPKIVIRFVLQHSTISYTWFAVQLTSFEIFIITQLFILSTTAYDHYVAICKPLLYVIIMSGKVRWALVLVPYLYSIYVFLMALIHTLLTFCLCYCHSNIINHFYCDDMPLLRLTCSDTHYKQLSILACARITSISSVLIVSISYMFIFSAILRIHSVEGRRKAFSTCSSHMMAVSIFYGTLIFMYLQPSSDHSLDTDKMASVFYTVIIPMLNPLIYNLRNKDVKDALKKVINSRNWTSVFRELRKDF
ncbi:olfactory receptor 8K1-like [Mesocricetus auratus]|uniref:Olfactory receptor 8K1-like n=1 Tax=Mesocricetus auratus TaxID=10036 RepID=A0ABM2XDM3_MESAU|nr:olfactory receptor 8K1-like [Mesocricetus auratus]